MQSKFEKKCEELQAVISVLEEENQLLSERAEETLLIKMVAESISLIDDSRTLLENTLEKISILKDIPYCSCYELKQTSARQIAAYAAFSDSYIGGEMQLASQIRTELNDGATIITGGSFREQGLVIDFDEGDFRPYTAFLCSFTTKTIPDGVFAFIDDERDEKEFSPMTMLLHHVVDMIVERLDKITLMNELKQLNIELDSRVKSRTRLLAETNCQLKIEIAERKQVEETLRESEARYRLLCNSGNDA